MKSKVGRSEDRVSTRPRFRALFAASLFVFTIAVVPVWAVLSACAMPCCAAEPSPVAVQSAESAACEMHCAAANDAASTKLPDGLAASALQQPFAPAVLRNAPIPGESANPASAQLPSFPVESHHSAPGDPPVYLANSTFLI